MSAGSSGGVWPLMDLEQQGPTGNAITPTEKCVRQVGSERPLARPCCPLVPTTKGRERERERESRHRDNDRGLRKREQERERERSHGVSDALSTMLAIWPSLHGEANISMTGETRGGYAPLARLNANFNEGKQITSHLTSC